MFRAAVLVEVNAQHLELDGFVGLESGAGDVHRAARWIIGLVGRDTRLAQRAARTTAGEGKDKQEGDEDVLGRFYQF